MATIIYYRDGEYVIYPAGYRMLFYHIWRAWRELNLAPWQITRIATLKGGTDNGTPTGV